MLNLLLSLCAGFVGFFFGSFLNVLIDRLPRGKAIFLSRSVCEKCNKQIKWYDLLPIVSYLLLGGKCRYCKDRIPFRLFLVEVFTGFIFAASFYYFTLTTVSYFEIVVLLLIIFGLLAVFLIDYFFGLIPDVLVLYLLLLSFVYIAFFDLERIFSSFLTGLGIFLFFLTVFFVTRQKGIGFGDVKFSFVIGLLLGFPEALLSLYISFIVGGVIAGALLLTGKKKLGGDTLPFGPFLVLGVFVMLFFSQQIVQIVYDLLL